jgi:hypothetical protein
MLGPVELGLADLSLDAAHNRRLAKPDERGAIRGRDRACADRLYVFLRADQRQVRTDVNGERARLIGGAAVGADSLGEEAVEVEARVKAAERRGL